MEWKEILEPQADGLDKLALIYLPAGDWFKQYFTFGKIVYVPT